MSEDPSNVAAAAESEETPSKLDEVSEGDRSPNLDERSEEPDTFPRDYVEKLRQENGKYRQRAQRADKLAEHLLAATVQATCAAKLADPADLLAYHGAEELADENGFPDEDRITAAAEELLLHKPHLAVRKPSGDIGQGARAGTAEPVSLSGMLRARAG